MSRILRSSRDKKKGDYSQNSGGATATSSKTPAPNASPSSGAAAVYTATNPPASETRVTGARMSRVKHSGLLAKDEEGRLV